MRYVAIFINLTSPSILFAIPKAISHHQEHCRKHLKHLKELREEHYFLRSHIFLCVFADVTVCIRQIKVSHSKLRGSSLLEVILLKAFKVEAVERGSSLPLRSYWPEKDPLWLSSPQLLPQHKLS